MKAYLVRGVPMRMQQDGWWLGTPENAPNDTTHAQRPMPLRTGALLALIALGDALFWGVSPGLSLAVFALICVLTACVLMWRRIARDRLVLASGLTFLSVLPVVEMVQPVSVAFLCAGLPVAALLLSGRPLHLWQRAVARFWLVAPVFGVSDAMRLSRRVAEGPTGSDMGQLLRGWALPLGVGTIFLALLIQANPVVETWLTHWDLTVPDMSRLMLWVGLGLIIWPVLSAISFGPMLAPARKARRLGPHRMACFINADAILRSLVLFNVLFAVQNAMDMAFLAGGVSLPDGLNYAEYAHRGAYPLLVLALLSGGFALVARPFIPVKPTLRALLLIWVAQTVWLTCSSLLRLDLYVDVYGLTHLRLAAGLWMGLVAAGLGMILWQIGRAHSNAWLVLRVGLLGIAVLYGSCFVSFDRMIAQYNLTHDVPRDWPYLRHLGEAAVPVFVAQDVPGYLHPEVSTPRDWREWGFRNARVRASLAALNEQATRP